MEILVVSGLAKLKARSFRWPGTENNKCINNAYNLLYNIYIGVIGLDKFPILIEGINKSGIQYD